MSEKFEFLSDKWMEAARELRDRQSVSTDHSVTLRMNQIIVSTPFGPDPIHAHLAVDEGVVVIDLGLLDNPDVTVTLEYATAKAILIDSNQSAALEAFLGGRIQVTGDMGKLLGLQEVLSPTDIDRASSFAQLIRDITV